MRRNLISKTEAEVGNERAMPMVRDVAVAIRVPEQQATVVRVTGQPSIRFDVAGGLYASGRVAQPRNGPPAR